jgi:hypothetical protein
MLASARNLSRQVGSLFCLVMLSQVGLAFGGIVPLTRDGTLPAAPNVIDQSNLQQAPTAIDKAPAFDPSTDVIVGVPVIEIAPEHSQTTAPTAVPLPPAVETGISGGAALMLAAGLRKLRRVIRRSA